MPDEISPDISEEEAAERRFEEDRRKAGTLVHARYGGTATVVMPDLDGRDRCCQKANRRDNDPTAAPNPHTLLEPGDVILLDQFSAEGRDDFEVVSDEPKATARPRAAKRAESRSDESPAE